MKKDPAVAKLLIAPESHLKFMESFLSGSPDYDFEWFIIITAAFW